MRNVHLYRRQQDPDTVTRPLTPVRPNFRTHPGGWDHGRMDEEAIPALRMPAVT
ncbi:hypothetical protein GCM10010319_69350 [Streptomyces blastmyceticus]|uniref:Uncharacterized protein n=1 Tax=Streptomyces blastmyceticus TaxID=68180 RepID=A0ABP3HUH1_9ACTN